MSKEKVVTCVRCNGSGQVSCYRCGGNGECPSCYGGKYKFPGESDAKIRICSVCEGTGVCFGCHGTGVAKCTSCVGTGSVTVRM